MPITTRALDLRMLPRNVPGDEDSQGQAGETGLLRADTHDVPGRNSVPVERLRRRARHRRPQEPRRDRALPPRLSAQ